MKTDANKKITSISYNHLNKPNVITTDSGSISYVYDASGNRLQKKIQQNGTTKIYDYIGNFVYEDSVLQYMLNEEGRARPVANINTNHYTRYVYDYFIKDHLGNVRSTVTAEPINSDYFAGHEIAMANVEQLIFDNIPNVREGKPGTINPNDGMAAQLIAADPDKRIGTAIMLRVMPGDKFTIDAQAFYEGSTVPEETIGAGDVISSLSSALMGGSTYAGVPIAELPENVQTIAQIFSNPGLVGQLEKVETKNYDPTAPKAHLNYLFFDDQMNLNAGLSGKIQVQANGGTGSWQTLQPGGNGATGTQICNCDINGPGTPGVVLIYVDNQSIGKDVWFDDLHIEHYTSSVLSEDHYYPFGLTVGIDQNTSVQTKQPYKLTTKELEKAFDLNYYDFGARMQDMQLGRWWGVDPLAEKFVYESPYVYAGNNPAINIDIDGRLKVQYGASASSVNSETRAAFNTIAKNVGNMLVGNSQAMAVLSNTSGLSVETINQYLTPGEGPTVTIGKTKGMANGGEGGINLDPNILTYLGGLDPASTDYQSQALGIGLTLLHELAHLGDQQTNGGANSGQSSEVIKGGATYKKFDGEAGVENSITRGAQVYQISPTGERGGDVDRIGFGVDVEVNGTTSGGPTGKINIQPNSAMPQTTNVSGIPLPPTSLPGNVQGRNILNTLGL